MSTKVRRNVPRNNRGRPARTTGRRNGNGGGSRPANAAQTLHKAKQAKEKYLNLARESMAAGDRVQAESYFQHVDHYVRVINSLAKEKEAADQRRAETEKSVEVSDNAAVEAEEKAAVPENKSLEEPVAEKSSEEEKNTQDFLPDFLTADA